MHIAKKLVSAESVVNKCDKKYFLYLSMYRESVLVRGAGVDVEGGGGLDVDGPALVRVDHLPAPGPAPSPAPPRRQPGGVPRPGLQQLGGGRRHADLPVVALVLRARGHGPASLLSNCRGQVIAVIELRIARENANLVLVVSIYVSYFACAQVMLLFYK